MPQVKKGLGRRLDLQHGYTRESGFRPTSPKGTFLQVLQVCVISKGGWVGRKISPSAHSCTNKVCQEGKLKHAHGNTALVKFFQPHKRFFKMAQAIKTIVFLMRMAQR